MKYLALVLALLVPQIADAKTYYAKVIKVVDGDTVNVSIARWKDTPFAEMALRVAGIDTPESMQQFAKCPKELALGVAAKLFARTLLKPGDSVRFVYLGHDKYFRIDATVILPSKQSWADVMIATGMAAPYNGGTKKNWCE
jgi:micrococcal nuclease